MPREPKVADQNEIEQSLHAAAAAQGDSAMKRPPDRGAIADNLVNPGNATVRLAER